ncbi:hypothetical protein BGZ63DRAFT_367933 [Mariannaea sp. PMI_226]|nr:hypothetical protein BGZ63DRAFT_367933 [Mariannaea sp. PMI_226]
MPAWILRTSVLFTCYLTWTSFAQNNPLTDFCRRWGHQSAVVDRKLYIDGGLVNYKPFGSSTADPFLLYNDLNSVSRGMPPLYANLSKNETIPDVDGGILWEDSVNKRLYLYGGEYHKATPPDFNLYSYDILNNYWVSFGPPTGAQSINTASYGAGVSVPSLGEAYYYGGLLSNASIPDWNGPPRATNSLIQYTMDSNSWSNLTGPDEVPRAEGAMMFIPIGDAGMLVYFGGSQDLHGNGTLTPQPLNEIFLYDVANAKWYTQKTSGNTPDIRRRFCGGATWADDQSSYNIYIYGGFGFPPNTTGYDDVYILTIPSFQWIRGPYPPHSNVSGPFPKNMMSCNVVDHAQMLVIGGTFSNDTKYSCDVPNIYGTHNMNLGEQDKDKAIWASYQPNLTTYVVPTDIITAVGGHNSGGATMTTPISGFDAPDLSVIMTRKAASGTRTPTRSIGVSTTTPNPPPPSSSSPTPPPGPSLSSGAIAGIVVGSCVALILALLGGWFFIRRRKDHHRRDSAAAPLPPPMGEMPVAYQYDPSVQMQNGWSGTQVSSPTMTTVSYERQQSLQPAGPPVELAGEGESPYEYRGMSPMSGKFELGGGQGVTSSN